MFIEMKDSRIFLNTKSVAFLTPTQITFTSGETQKLRGNDYETFIAAVEKEQHRIAIRHGALDI